MKYFIVFALVANSTFATTLHCKGDMKLHQLSLDLEKKTFSFLQSCWNPCNSGEGEIVSGPRRGWAGIMYSLNLTRSIELISPMKTRKLMLFLDHDGKTGTLSDQTGRINVECQIREEQ